MVSHDPFHGVLQPPQPLHTRAEHSFLFPGGAGLFQPLSQRPGISEPPDRPVDPQYPLCATQQRTGGERGEAAASCLCFRLVLQQDPSSVTTNHPKTQWLHSYSVHTSAGQLAIVVLARPAHRSVMAWPSADRGLPSSSTLAQTRSHGAGSKWSLGTSPHWVTMANSPLGQQVMQLSPKSEQEALSIMVKGMNAGGVEKQSPRCGQPTTLAVLTCGRAKRWQFHTGD